MMNLGTITFLPDCSVPPGDGPEEIRILEAFAASGARHMVLSHRFCRRHLEEPAFIPSLSRRMAGLGLDFLDCHAPYGRAFDFNGDGSGAEGHHRLLGLCGELGIKTYTVHLGGVYGDQTVPAALSRARRSVESLLPWAEDAGVVLCVENIYYPTTTAGNLLALLEAFPSSHFGFCYDSGHGNVMTKGVRAGILCDWVRSSWERLALEPACEDFTALWPYLVTCHLHDNPGDSDAHMPPGQEGCTIDWEDLSARLEAAPRLVSRQTEVHGACYGWSASEIVRAFERIGSR